VLVLPKEIKAMSTPSPSPRTTESPGGSTPSAGTSGSIGTSQGTGATGTSQATVASGPSNVAGSLVQAVVRTVKRTKNELHKHGGLFDEDIVKQKYSSRGTKECVQWAPAVTLGIDSKFSTVKSDAIEDEQFKSVYDLLMRVAKLKTSIKQNGLISTFDIFEVDSDGKIIESTARNLLDDYANLTLDEVKTSPVEFRNGVTITKYGLRLL
jgi:hypothetical protein